MKAFTFDEKSLAVKALVRSNPTGDALHAANEAILLGAYRILNLARKSRPAVGGAQ
jgi:DNA-binding LacI/PurR family transcriptional regulator